MPRNGWHITRNGDALTLSRAASAQFDLSAQTTFDEPDLRRGRMAHQIRQDMWRRLQDVCGFRPAIRVTRTAHGLDVTAGGAVAGRVTPRMRNELADLLADPVLRRRWVTHARRHR